MSRLITAPCLIPLRLTENIIQYSGYLTICGQAYQVSLQIPEREGLHKAEFCCEWKLQYKIKEKTSLIEQRLKTAVSVGEFFRDFIDIAETCVNDATTYPLVCSARSSRIISQLQEIGWSRLLSLDEDFSSIQLGCHDEAGRLHKLKIVFSKQDPNSAPVCLTDLPEKFDFHWSSQSQLKHLVQQFESVVDSYQAFWDTMSELDLKCWILEPEQVSFSCTYRRLGIGPNISLHIKVNPRQPRTLPDCRLLGAQTAVASLREKLNVNLHRWEVDRSLLNNLQEVLDIDFPSRADTRKEDLSVDCGICYSEQLHDQRPDIVCENGHCGQAFHPTCLYEWLRSLSSRQSFNTIYGECPFCSQAIHVKMPSG